ncbi:hypothetical protein M8J76_004774 [Diaphorina citri]|nr:hypothetical protein M8J75_004162 [Diaphorina citri]KAI5740522.1 hypothetical protein M8J76_004774 [Diaphorina citri]
MAQSAQHKTSKSQVSNHELREVANKAVFYLLAVHGCKGIVKRNDLTNAVLGKEHRRHFRTIIDLANNKLKMVFGLKVVPTDDKFSTLMLINCLERRSGAPLNIDTEFKTLDSFLLLVLAVIFMNNDSITEGALLRFLETLGYSENYYDNDVGKITDVLKKDLVNQCYLNYSPVESAGDEIQYAYSWGIRARHQVKREKILKFVSKVYECDPSFWLEQHMKVQEEKENLTDTELDESQTDDTDVE